MARRTGPRLRLPAVLCAAVLSGAVLCRCGGDTGSNPPGRDSIPRIELVPVADHFDSPVQITSARDGSGRLFVVEQQGIITIVRNGGVLESPFLDIRSIVLSGGERGLLSVAFPPRFGSVEHFYINYTRSGDGATVVARYGVNPGDRDDALEEGAEILLTVPQPYANHNGGMMAFGPDGYLYIGLGDGGGAGDPDGNGQDPGTLLGSILRIDVESGVSPYGVPNDNPFVDREGYRREIWAIGLRNPWRFSFDRTNRDLYIADVGQALWEEINVQPGSSGGGENYGWNIMEGAHCYNTGSCNTDTLVPPVYEYGHGTDCSVTGGYVYRGWRQFGMRGVYFFGDYCSGRIRGLTRADAGWRAEIVLDTDLRIVSFGEDEEGEIYVVDLRGGVYRITMIPSGL